MCYVYQQQAASSLGALGQRLAEQEDHFAGRAASFQREILHLQKLVRDKQQDLDEVLQQKRQVEGELEVVWEAATRENQKIRKSLHGTSSKSSIRPLLQHSPMFESDSDQRQNPSSDESEKNAMDFYS
ncbi:hypothetical protein UPYG_G00164320 [Umbra pygmaea]|uniref:Uncharacterized protein n=1 Tax=Umbra pygmaea TaxID=75934 RepID=A0ABD0WM83_UMBPY